MFQNSGKYIGVNVHYIPVHQHPYYKKLFNNNFENTCLNAEVVYHQILSLPIFPNLSKTDVGKIASEISANHKCQKMKNLPIASRLINEGSLITKKDLCLIKQIHQLTFNEILDLQSKKFIIKNQIEKNSTILFENFKKASIGIAVACRMKSSRLKRKAI